MGLSLPGGVNCVKENLFYLLNFVGVDFRQEPLVAQGPQLAPGVPAQPRSGATGRELAH